ncbi:MAG: hypothetical protein JO301_16665 [Chitinophagaceae bacterium]|nr:hypothetical protein [Chitinophagaceae bacterium]
MKIPPYRVLLFICINCMAMAAFGQQVDLFKMQDSTNTQTGASRGEPVLNTFYSTRLVNTHTVEITGKGSMDFRINHRFAPLNSGLYNMFGLDAASMRMGFDFGIANNLMIGIGRSTLYKELDWFIKYRLVHQREGGSVPISVALLAAWAYRTLDYDPTLKVSGSDRTYFTGALLIGSKLSSTTSIQVSPTYTHYNRVLNFNTTIRDLFAIGLLARQRVSRRMSINAEYVIQTNRFPGTYDPLSLGVDINTGGHVFQLHFTNSSGMNEHSAIHETTGSWGNGDVRWGFNISRIFNIGRRH